MKRSLLPAAAVLVLTVAACGNSGPATPSPSAVRQTVGQAVCDAQGKVLDAVAKAQASPPSKADLVAQLQQLQNQLNSQAATLDSQGQATIATQVRNAATGLGQLATAVNGTDPAAVVAAAAVVANAIRQIPGCPSSSPSG
jgi:predicted small lipoprotein YifL